MTNIEKTPRLKLIEHLGFLGDLIVDTLTGIEYVKMPTGSGMTPLVDANGLPRINDKYKEK